MASHNRDYEIVSIIEACRCMGSDKITERRKSAENLQKLLGNKAYVEHLDVNSDSSSGFTWNDVFKAACVYKKKEVDKYRQDEEKGIGSSLASKTSRENHLVLTSNCLLNIIEMGCERKPRLDIDLVLHHCLTAFKDSFLVDKFARDYLTALNRIILPIRKYWSQLKPNLWLSLFLLTLKIMKSPLPPNVTFVSLATLLNSVVHRGGVQSDLSRRMRKKIPFFIESLTNKQVLHKEHHLLKIWLDTSIHVAFCVGQQDRHLLCNLTENTLNTFLDYCHEKVEDIELIVQFSLIAMVAHHPSGVKCHEVGFVALKSLEEWQQILRRLFSLTDFIIKSMNQRNQTAENQIYELTSHQVSLAVRVARQIFDRSANGEVSKGADSLPPCKKKRILSGPQEIIDRLKTNGATDESIPWLQILNELLLADPQLLQLHELKELLQYVIDVTDDCRVYSMTMHCYTLFRTLICIRQKEILGDVNVDGITKLWHSIWKCLAARQCQKEGLLLLASLVHFRLVPASIARNLIYQLARKSVPCTLPAMICLVAFLDCYKLPQGFVERLPERDDDALQLSWTNYERHRSIKSLLVEWLLDSPLLLGDDYDAVLLKFRLVRTLVLQQPGADLMDVTELMDRLKDRQVASAFQVQCHQLEAGFRYIELMPDALDDVITLKEPRPVSSSAESGYQASLVQQVFIRMDQLCTEALQLLEHTKKISNAELESVYQALHVVALVRNTMRMKTDYAAMQEHGIRVLDSLLDVIFTGFVDGGEGVNSKRCLQHLIRLFNDDCSIGSGDDPFRQVAWNRCCRKLSQLLSATDTSTDAFGSIRRGGGGIPTCRTVALPEKPVTESLFDGCALNDRDALNVEMYRFLATLCCPRTQPESGIHKSDLVAMKMQLVSILTGSKCDRSSLVFLQTAFCLIRCFSRCTSPDALDAPLVAIVVELVTDIVRNFIHDHEAATAVLQLLPDVGRHVSAAGSDGSKTKFILVLRRFQSGVCEDLFGPPVEAAYYRCLALLSTVDPSVHWLVWKAGSIRFGDPHGADQDLNQSDTPIVVETLAGLTRPLNSTAIRSSQVIQHLFSDGMFENDPAGRCRWQDQVFSALCWLVSKPLDGLDEQDASGRFTVFLQTFSSITAQSGWMEKRALFWLLKLWRISGVADVSVLKRSVQVTAGRLGVKYIHLMEARMEYLLEQWLEEEELEEFPYQLYCTHFNLFLRTYRSVIVPAVFLKKDLQVLSKYCMADGMAGIAGMGGSVTEVLSECVIDVVAKILPQLDRWKNKYQQMEEAIGGAEAMSQTLRKHFWRLLSGLVSRTYDANVTALLFGASVVLPPPGSFHFRRQSIMDTIERFSADVKTSSGNISGSKPFESVIILISTQPWPTHLILLDVFGAYEEAECRLQDRQQALVRLFVLVEMLTIRPEAATGLLDVQNYVFHQLVHRLGRVVRQEKQLDTLRRGSLVVLKRLLSAVVRHWPELVANLLLVIVGYVTPVATEAGSLQWLAVDLLDLLIVDHRVQLKDVIAQLSPFPDIPQFDHLRRVLDQVKRERSGSKPQSLDEEVDNFLRLVDLLEDDVTVESVRHLSRLLANHKDQLRTLYQQLADGSGSSDDCVRSRLHRLICCLIQLSKKRTSPQVRSAIGGCLGELGATDLTTLLLQGVQIDDESTAIGAMAVYSRGHIVQQLGLAVIPLLVRYLFCGSIQLLQQAALVLRHTFETYEGQQFYALARKFAWPELKLLIAFKPVKRANKDDYIVDPTYVEQSVDDADVWMPSTQPGGGHSQWVKRLTCTLIGAFRASGGGLFSAVLPICQMEAEFCSRILPYVIQYLLTVGDVQVRKTISKHVNDLLKRYCGGRGDAVDAGVKSVLKTMLHIIQHLRHEKRPKWHTTPAEAAGDTSWKNNFWMDLNYLYVAQAARWCHAHFSAVMYAEIWLDRFNRDGQSEHTSAGAELMDAEEGRAEDVKLVQDLLLTAYTSTGEPDSFTAFQSVMDSNPHADVRRYQQESKWFQALECNDALASYSGGNTHQSVLDCLSHCGLYRTMADLTSSYNASAGSSPEITEYQYECAWRLGTWDLKRSDPAEEKPGLHQLLFQSLLALKNVDLLEFRVSINQARLQILDQLVEVSLESCRNIYPALTSLQLVRDVEEVGQLPTWNADAVPDSYQRLKSKWLQSNELSFSEFRFREPVLALRAVIIKDLLIRPAEVIPPPRAGGGGGGGGGAIDGPSLLIDTLLHTSRVARQHGNYQVAGRCISQLTTLDLDVESKYQCRLEKAYTEWQRKDRSLDSLFVYEFQGLG